MPHSRYHWASQIKGSEREYRAVRVGVDWLLEEHTDEIDALIEAREWDNKAALDLNAADRNLDATYLIRMFLIFERAVSSYWRSLKESAGRAVKGDILLKEVGIECKILADVTRNAQEVRIHRNNLVHDRIVDHAAIWAFQDARRDLLTYLSKLPDEWG